MFKKIYWFFQRGTRGWADCDSWNLNSYIQNIVVGGVSSLRENSDCYPMQLESEQWNEILDKIIIGFKARNTLDEQIVRYGDSRFKEEKEKLEKQWEEGFQLFYEYFDNLSD